MWNVVRGAFCAALLGLAAACSSGPPADLILTGGEVYTPEGWAEAVAVRDGVIVAVGDAETVDGRRGPDTRVIELAGAAVLPGLNDSHAHPSFAALESGNACRVPLAPWDAIVGAVAACTQGLEPGEWVFTGPIANELVGSQSTRQSLDAVAPDNPVIVYAVGGHAVVANSLALEAAGIDRATPTPQGAVIERDADGEPTGVLLEAQSLWVSALPQPDPEAAAPAVAAALDQFLAMGVTSVTDANVRLTTVQAYALAADAGLLRARVRPCLLWEPGDDSEAAARSLVDGGYARERLAPTCVKIFLDGETATGRTGALIDPYQPADGSTTGERGALAVPTDALADAVARFDRAGLTVKFHAWGDAAVDAALTAIESALAANGADGPPHEVGHVFLARIEDIARAKEAGAVLEFSPSAWFTQAIPLGRDIGEPRVSRVWPVRDALDVGAPAVGGTDWPSGPPQPYNVWPAIATLVTRLDAGSDVGEPFAPDERVTLQEAIALFTAYPAMHSGDPAAPGIIAPGRKADLVVLDRNPFEIPITEVPQTTAVMTIVGGEVVYEAAVGPGGG